jgi:hypothetical protein
MQANLLALENKATTLHGIYKDVPALEVCITAPRSHKVNDSAIWKSIIFRVDIKEPNLVHTLSGRVLRDGADVENMETSTVVALVGEAIVYVLVVVNAVRGGLVVSSLFGGFEIGDVPDISDEVAVGSKTLLVVLVILVIGDKILVPLWVEEPALVNVRCSLIGSLGEHLGVGLVGNVIAVRIVNICFAF